VGPPGEDDLAGLRLQLVRVQEALPDGFEALRAEADAEGHRNMTVLAAEFAQDPGQFTAILAAYGNGELVGIGALTPEPDTHPGGAFRMRRLYVARAARRQGVARALANALLTEALNDTRLVTVHAGNPAAERFWEALGYKPVAGRAWSHQMLFA
jgi:GNAT superfamily N-acetyltransferase